MVATMLKRLQSTDSRCDANGNFTSEFIALAIVRSDTIATILCTLLPAAIKDS